MYFVRAMATVYFARWILLPDGGILLNGGLTVDGDRIAAVGPRGKLKRSSRDRAVNLGDMLLVPGFINMHTHLEEAVLRGMEKSEDEPFCSWMARRRHEMAQSSPGAIISSARLAIRESLANGITTVADTTRTDIAAIVLRDEPIRSWVFHESHPESSEDQNKCLAGLLKRIERSHRRGNIGIAPYALFSLSPRLHRQFAETARTKGYGWSCHIAESAEELQAFSVQSGELFERILCREPWPYGLTERGSMYYALTNNLIPQHGICLHCNYMSGQELSLLTARSASIVFCPRYNALAGHKAFPLDVALNHGGNVCLGTESPASSMPMDLLDDLFQLKMTYPHVTAFQLVQMVTANAARALRCPHIGNLQAGNKADITGLRFPHDPKADILEEMIIEETKVVLVIVDGEEVVVGY